LKLAITNLPARLSACRGVLVDSTRYRSYFLSLEILASTKSQA
jgi:hypothetical protein